MHPALRLLRQHRHLVTLLLWKPGSVVRGLGVWEWVPEVLEGQGTCDQQCSLGLGGHRFPVRRSRCVYTDVPNLAPRRIPLIFGKSYSWHCHGRCNIDLWRETLKRDYKMTKILCSS